MIEVIVMDKELYAPTDIAPKTLGSAGLDLKLTRDAKSAHQIAAEGGEWPYQDLIPTGIRVRVPTNMVGLIVPRSSSGHKHGFKLGNTIGIIDSDYRGEIMMSIGGGDYGRLKRGATVAQLILVPYSSFYGATIVDRFSDETGRGDGGFGSTDKLDAARYMQQAEQGTSPSLMDIALHSTITPVSSIAAVEQMLRTSQDWATLPVATRGVVGEARHQASCELAEERRHLLMRNGGF